MLKEGKLRFIGVVEEAGETAKVRIFQEFCEGLKQLSENSHVIILYWLHLRNNQKDRDTLQVLPRRHPGATVVGVFASRSPSRPNPIALCVAELVKVENCTLFVRGLDAVEGSPIVDVKPYIPRADAVPDARVPEWALRGPPT